jgi:hypothetical protein
MQVETERYLTKIRDSVEEIRNKEQLPKWQIDFEKYGGRLAYETFKHFYWKRFDMGFKNNDGLSPDVYKLMEQFRKDLHVKLDIPKKYDIYR